MQAFPRSPTFSRSAVLYERLDLYLRRRTIVSLCGHGNCNLRPPWSTWPTTSFGYVRGVGSRNEFVAAAFRLQQPGDLSDIVTTNRGAYLVQLVERIPMDEAAFAQEKETLREQMLNRERNEL